MRGRTRSLIAHNSDTSHIGEPGEILSDTPVQSCVGDLFSVDRICILHDLDLLRGHLADDTDSKSRSREGLTEYKVFRDSKFKSGFSNLIFEQVSQRLDDLFEINIIRQTSHIVV